MEWERAEKAKVEAELEAQRQKEAEKQRRAEELRLAQEHDAKMLYEQHLRIEQLTSNLTFIDHILQLNFQVDLEEKEANAVSNYFDLHNNVLKIFYFVVC